MKYFSIIAPSISATITATTVVITLSAGLNLAYAHVTLEQAEAEAGQSYKAVLRLPHGCDGKPTTAVNVVLPEGFVGAQPQFKTGWTISATKGDYQQSYTIHGKEITSGITEIRWSDGNLPNELYDEFVVLGTLANLDKDTTLSFPITQFCGPDTTVAWTEIASAGQNAHDLKRPAAQLLVKASHQHDHAAVAVKLGDLALSDATIRAMVPGAKVGGGYLTIANEGKAADRLVSAISPTAERVEIHEMTLENQVMKMRQLKDGLSVPAGETVELKPGGYHLMLMNPAKPYAEGEKIPVTLEFEKAGKVELEFQVTPASGKAASEHDHH